MTIIELTEEQAQLFRNVQLPARLVDSLGRFVAMAEPVGEETLKALHAYLKARRDQQSRDK
jgi:hypothetical protein